VLPTDLTRCSTLNAPFRSQIAPRSNLCARVDHGLLRVQHLKPLPRVRIAPHSTLSFPCRSQIAPRSTLRALPRSRIAPRSAIDAQCRSTDISVRLHFAPCAVHGLLRAQHFKLRTVHRLLCVRRLHFVPIANCSALLTPCLVLLADCSVLNTWSFAPSLLYNLLGTSRSAPYEDYSWFETWICCCLRISPHSTQSSQC